MILSYFKSVSYFYCHFKIVFLLVTFEYFRLIAFFFIVFFSRDLVVMFTIFADLYRTILKSCSLTIFICIACISALYFLRLKVCFFHAVRPFCVHRTLAGFFAMQLGLLFRSRKQLFSELWSCRVVVSSCRKIVPCECFEFEF